MLQVRGSIHLTLICHSYFETHGYSARRLPAFQGTRASSSYFGRLSLFLLSHITLNSSEDSVKFANSFS